MHIPFDELKDDSRIWIFQANRKLSESEADLLSQRIHSFTSQWAAHGNPLRSSFTILNDLHLIVGVDLTLNQASGCSIDALVRTIQEAGNELNIDFFDRKALACELEGNAEVISFENIVKEIETGRVESKTITFNNLVSVKGELKNGWRIKASESWIKRYFSKTASTT